MPRAMVRAKTVNFLPDFEAECMIMHDLAIHLFCSPNLKCISLLANVEEESKLPNMFSKYSSFHVRGLTAFKKSNATRI